MESREIKQKYEIQEFERKIIMKKITQLLAVMTLSLSGLAFAQNTQREPLAGGMTNPVTPTEAKDPNLAPDTKVDIVHKKKTKGTITVTPTEPAAPTKPTTETKSTPAPTP